MSILIKGLEMPIGGKRLSIDIYPNGKVCTNLDLDCKQIATAVSVSPQDSISRGAAKRTMSMFIGYGKIDEDMVRRFEIALDAF